MGKVHRLPPPPGPKLPPPPDHLEEPEADMWRQFLNTYEIDTVGEQAVLAEALASHMRARRCRERIAQEGEIIRDRFGQSVAHPLLVAERNARQAFVSAMKTLRVVDAQPQKPGAF